MDSNCDFAGAKLGAGLLVREARDYKGKHFAFARREQGIAFPQLGQFRSLLPRSSIHSQGGIDRFQQIALAEWFR
jgi:hypothetical protein